MTTPGHFTHTEILSQPQAWNSALTVIRDQADTIARFFNEGGYDSLLFTGCGSTYYLSIAVAAIAQELLGIPARGLPASEIWLYPQSAYTPGAKTLLVAVSRSGETTETVRACQAFHDQGGKVLTLSCYPDKILTTLGDLNLVFPSGREESIAQTRAFSTLYLAAVALIAIWSDRADVLDDLGRLPAVGQALLSSIQPSMQAIAQDAEIDRFYFLGSGMRYGLACELSLKMKEMSLSHSEPFYFMEFRHGPKSMVTPNTQVIGLLSESNHEHELAVLDEMRAMGARVLTIGEHSADVTFDSNIAEIAQGVLYLPAGQLLALERSLFNDLNPDRPNNLDAVVKLA